MSAKTIFIIVATTLVTIILMKNTDEVTFWIFGNRSVPKLAILGVMFGTGLVLGYLLGKPKRIKELILPEYTEPEDTEDDSISYGSKAKETKWISPEDEEYIR